MPTPIVPVGNTTMHRYTVRPKHLDQWHEHFIQAVGLRNKHGFTTHRVFVETDAEPKVTWIYSHPDHEVAEQQLKDDPRAARVDEQLSHHVFQNTNVRPVQVERVTHARPGELEGQDGRIAVMRRYDIVGDFDEFIEIWKRIVPVRERHGFRCLFAVSDREKGTFTWALDFHGSWEEFPAGQHDYYHDPERRELSRVFDHMADYSLHPARMLI